jgi:isoquinoline 1-oxidoreductase beta subunit
MAVVSVKAGLGSAGNIVAWDYRSVSQSIFDQRGFLAPGAIDSQAVEGSVALPYNLGAKLVEWVPLPAGIPVGFWRSVGCSFNSFVVESVIDELAAAGGLDPLAFRKSLVPAGSREWAVLDAADKLSSWRHSLPAGHAWGVAWSKAFLTEVCEVVEISQPAAGSLTVHQVACVVDCGLAVNPNQIEAQMQGGIVHGLNAALWGQITFSKGSSSVRNFNSYRMIKLREMPVVTVQILNSGAPIGGIGEPGVPPIAPAIANAYFRLTGTRVRTLPLFPGARMGELG